MFEKKRIFELQYLHFVSGNAGFPVWRSDDETSWDEPHLSLANCGKKATTSMFPGRSKIILHLFNNYDRRTRQLLENTDFHFNLHVILFQL